MRKRLYWKLAGREIVLGDQTLLAGWIPATPEAAPDGVSYLDPDRAFARAVAIEESGASLLEVSADIPRPGGRAAGEEEHLHRLIPVLKRLRGKLSIPVVVTTSHASVAVRAMEMGAEVIRDTSGLTVDAQLSKVVQDHSAALVLTHSRGTPETWAKLPPMSDPVTSVAADLGAAANRARKVHIENNRLAVDPGLGFGKRREDNARILAGLPRLLELDVPLTVELVAPNLLVNGNPLPSFLAAVTAAVLGGAHWITVFDPAAVATAVEGAELIRRSQAPE